ncbi:hypothetical protein [Kitasatospora sp. NBC_01560]|uniref:hypothetical protein n=1 Tax=Kitasatospora sp. NBC_01560 TaxID=2975965 RepID=UPI003862FA26
MAAAVFAGAFPLVSGLGPHRVWGVFAATGYLGAAVAALVLPRSRALAGSAAVAAAGAVAVPLLLLVVTGQGQSEVGVIERSGGLLLRQGSPYLPEPHTVAEYTPYLPGLALLGLPRALAGSDGWAAGLLGDARLWCAAVFLGCLLATGRPHRRGLALLTASPLVALPLCVSGVDLPMTGLCCLALAAAARGRATGAGLVLAAACALKWTAWPAVPVAAALLASTAGRRAALRAAAVALAGTAALVLPVALRAPGPLVQQVFAFPTGRGALPTPAGSPLPGHLLAGLGPAGWYAAVALLLAGGLAVAVSLVRHPPRDVTGAADRLALGLGLAFLLAPAGRFGYLALPLVLAVWARLPARARPAARRSRLPAGVPGAPGIAAVPAVHAVPSFRTRTTGPDRPRTTGPNRPRPEVAPAP